MRKAFVAFGIILVFVGVIVASASTTPIEKPPRTSTVAKVENKWEVSGRFHENEKLLVDFPPPRLGDLLIPEPTLKILIEITGPLGGKTVFEMEFSQGFGGNVEVEISLVSKEDGLTVSDPPMEVGGIVHYTGDYLANITTRRLWGPPTTLELKVEVVETEYPYLFVLPVGVALIVIGGCLSVWGAKSSKRKLRSRMKKR